MWLLLKLKSGLRNCLSLLPVCPTCYDCPTSSTLSALLTCQLEILRLNDVQLLFNRPYFANSFSLTLWSFHSVLLLFSPTFIPLTLSGVCCINPSFQVILNSSHTDVYCLFSLVFVCYSLVSVLNNAFLSSLCASTVLHPPPAHLLPGDSVYHAFLHLPRQGKTPKLLSMLYPVIFSIWTR